MEKDYSAHYASESEIAEIAEGMIACDLPKERWTHAAHFATAVWIIQRRPDLDAARDMPGLIARYNQSRGGRNTDTEGYHETITQASVRATRKFIDGLSPAIPLHEVVNALLATPLGRPDWILRYWSRDALFSPTARLGWIEPDIEPLPF